MLWYLWIVALKLHILIKKLWIQQQMLDLHCYRWNTEGISVYLNFYSVFTNV